MSRRSTGLSRKERKSVQATGDLDALMDITRTREFLGGVSKMTIHRWMTNPSLDFPLPLKIGARNYWQRGDLIDFRDRQRAKTPPRTCAPVPQTGGRLDVAADKPDVS